MIVTVASTWTVADWRHGYMLSAALDAKEMEIRTSAKESMELEALLQLGRQQNENQTKEVVRYVELQSDDPVCFDAAALQLFNRVR